MTHSPTLSSSGILSPHEPFTFSYPTSLSVEFSFSVFSNGHDLLLVLAVGDNISNYVGVEFDKSKDNNIPSVVMLARLLLSMRKFVFHFHFIYVFSPKTLLSLSLSLFFLFSFKR